MAKPRPLTEIPRFLLPRLSWTSATTQINPPQRHALRAITQGSSIAQTRPFSSGQIAQNATTATAATTSGRDAIRHNGVYVAASRNARRAFSTTIVRKKDHHFDTLKFVQRLRGEGFSEEQAVAMMRVLNDVIEESIQNLTRTMVLKEDAERSTYTQKVDFAKLRSELSNADSTEAQLTRSSHERLTSDLAKLNSRLRDEIGRTQASVRLDLNLEKGRIREEASTQENRIKETEARIEQEVASLRERIELSSSLRCSG
ncbi:Protein FMP32, mitochondrial [Cyphellophora attinorum]|uniref:Protein FMP32, mitochondrial n=1 Tax=Cyphellophora attinorum TaxID=1664694 RepID=A0A0N1I1L0_9EURO|nr:Protein FMP32, mitochondrial [Phialophora attinorum]KPI45787.1 Protein FMP32, mitochondrial [Phialophora attinorum]